MAIMINYVALLLANLLCCAKSVTATPAFTSTPQDPSSGLEGKNFTLEWNFTLDGTLGFIQIFNVTDLIASRFGPGAVTVKTKYQSRFRGQATNTRAELTILELKRSDESTYKINVVSSNNNNIEHEMELIVQYQSSITSISKNQTVDDGDMLWLNCTADGNPTPRITWIMLSNNSVVNMPLTITGKQDEGCYRCTADNGIGNPATADICNIVRSYRPLNTNFSTNLTNAALLNETFYLMCSAEANPAAEFRLYKNDESLANITAVSQNISLFRTSVSERVEEVTYKCIPFNSFGDGPTKTITVTVHYPVEATGNGTNFTVAEGGAKNLLCSVDGNPKPNINWYKGSEASGNPLHNGSVLMLKDVTESACYICVASNSLRKQVKISYCLIVDPNLTTVSSITVPRQNPNLTTVSSNTVSRQSTTSAPPTTKQRSTTSAAPDSPPTLWIIIGCATGVVVVLAICVLTWWVHKKRKCIKDAKSKDQTLLASRRSHEGRQQSCFCWPTYKRVISNV